MKSPNTIGDFFGRIRSSDFSDFAHFRQSAASGWLGFGVLCLLISLLMTYSMNILPKRFEVGMIAARDIKADRNYEIVDEEATEKLRKDALQNVLPVFDFDEEVGRAQGQTVLKTFDTLRGMAKGGWDTLTPAKEKELREFFTAQTGVALTTADWGWLLRTRFSKGIAEQWGALLDNLFSHWIIADRKNLTTDQPIGGILIRRIKAPESIKKENLETHVEDFSKILTVEEVKALVEKTTLPFPFHSRPLPTIVQTLTQKMLASNVNFNRQETETRRDLAGRSVKNVTVRLQTGESIIRSGARYEPWHIKVLEGIQKEKSKGAAPLRFLGTFLFVALALGVTFYFSERFVKRFAPIRQDYVFIGFILVVVLSLMRLSVSLAGALHDEFFYNFPTSALYYAIPIAGGVMMVRMILSAEISLIVAVLLSLLAGIFIGSDVNYTAYCLISSVAAGSAIAKAEHRSAIIRAGVYTGLVNALVALGIYLLQSASVTGSLTFASMGAHLGFAFFGGLSASFFVFILMPFVESIFDYTTNIKLLELANLNHPLLKELIVRAPGTYHHSHIVGVLAEAGSEAVGANSLLARVGAYYHDIGKMKKPTYFVENIGEGENRHDVLSPHMSALIVQSHVKDGIALARAHKLPQRIIDMIPQHHGTKMIGHFYERAKEISNPEMNEVEEKDFRYLGPKPQSREAGILMLADGAEAAVRALKEKSPARIQQVIEMIIDKSFVEAQLDECDLTLKDLHEIGKAFNRILIALHHQRVEYPEGASDTTSLSSESSAASDKNKRVAEKTASTVTRLRLP